MAHTTPSQRIDGDFYDLFKHSDDCFDVIVGDVMGKGIPAALVGAATKSQFLRAMSRLLSSPDRKGIPRPDEIVGLVHTEITQQLIDLETFVTVCFARFDMQRCRVDFVDCGPTATLHIRSRTGDCELLKGKNMPLGISREEVYEQTSVPFSIGDTFFFLVSAKFSLAA